MIPQIKVIGEGMREITEETDKEVEKNSLVHFEGRKRNSKGEGRNECENEGGIAMRTVGQN